MSKWCAGCDSHHADGDECLPGRAAAIELYERSEEENATLRTKLDIAVKALKELAASDAYSQESKHMGINLVASKALVAIQREANN